MFPWALGGLWGSVNMNILWDTGAFGLVFSKLDFSKLQENGAELYDLNLSTQTFGVLHIRSEAHYFLLNDLRIGQMVVNNIVCLYNPDFENSLLGLDFFHKFSDAEWHMKDGALSLFNGPLQSLSSHRYYFWFLNHL